MKRYFKDTEYTSNRRTIIAAVIVSIMINVVITLIIVVPQIDKINNNIEYLDMGNSNIEIKDVTYFNSDCPHNWIVQGSFSSNYKTLTCNKCGMITTVKMNKEHTYMNIPKDEEE